MTDPDPIADALAKHGLLERALRAGASTDCALAWGEMLVVANALGIDKGQIRAWLKEHKEKP
jgi:hypothetical protein